MDEFFRASAQSKKENEFDAVPRAHRLVRQLVWLYAGAALAVVLWLFLGSLLVPAMVREWIFSGLGAIVLSTLLAALAGLLAALVLTGTRFQYAAMVEVVETEPTEPLVAPDARKKAKIGFGSLAGIAAMPVIFALPGGPSTWDKRVAGFFGSRGRATAYYQKIKANPGFAARQGQAFILTVGALLVWIAERWLVPAQAVAIREGAAGIGVAAVCVVMGLAFASLVAERFAKEFPEPQLPEVPAIRRLLLFTTVVLVAAAILEVCRIVGITWLYWPAWILAYLPGVIMLELVLRALARLFLPPPQPAAATAVTDSVIVSLITGGPRAPGLLVRTYLGLDFSRSYALTFLTKAALPALVATGLLCWGLTGVKLIDIGQRGVYERLGAPVAVLGPGLHIMLPWPLGRLRPVEYGAIHSVAVGVDQADADDSILTDAEAPAPLTLNRLWETAHPGQAHYLVPSTGTGPQGFQSVDTEISVLYRVGLTNAAALQSVYSVADPASLIRDDAGRLVLRFFNSRTLDAVIGARRENIEGALRDQLVADVDSQHAGIEIISVLIEEIHPPAGAASAYHAVQAAQINSTASIFEEQARAELTAGTSQQQAYQTTTAADAQAAETTRSADAAAYRFNADRRAFATGGKAFLTERYYANLQSALSKVPVTILDHHLSPGEGPLLDMRGLTATSGTASGGTSRAAAVAPLPLTPEMIEGGH